MKTIGSMLLIVASTAMLWLALEAGTRFILFWKTDNSSYLTYGIAARRSQDNESHERVHDAQGNQIYWKCTPSDDQRNPVNRLGFRGPEVAPPRHGSVRVVCFGGSTTYGLGLAYADTYPKLLQEALDRAAGRGSFDVINAGIAAFKLEEIINLYKYEAVHLKPDIVVIMSVFNNLVDDDKAFYFIRVDDKNDNRIQHAARRLTAQCKKYSLLVYCIDNIAMKGFKNMLRDLHWEQGAAAIMRSTKVWKAMEANLSSLCELLAADNPAVKIIIIDEPMNTIDFPELAAPMEMAYLIQQRLCGSFEHAHHMKLAALFDTAQRNGQKIWLEPVSDPIHLSRLGNELLASAVAETILAAEVHHPHIQKQP